MGAIIESNISKFSHQSEHSNWSQQLLQTICSSSTARCFDDRMKKQLTKRIWTRRLLCIESAICCIESAICWKKISTFLWLSFLFLDLQSNLERIKTHLAWRWPRLLAAAEVLLAARLLINLVQPKTEQVLPVKLNCRIAGVCWIWEIPALGREGSKQVQTEQSQTTVQGRFGLRGEGCLASENS